MKINVLGTKYTIKFKKTSQDPALETCGGYCDMFAKIIVVGDISEREGDPSMTSDIREYHNKILRHELIHAFFYESGMDDYSRDETLVDMLAIQFEKLIDIMLKAGAIDG